MYIDMTPKERVVSNVWKKAGELLGINVQAPYVLNVCDRSYVCLAFLPQFGGSNGIILRGTEGPSFEVDEQFIADAKSQGFNWSYLNLDEYSVYDEEHIKEALDDWGKYQGES